MSTRPARMTSRLIILHANAMSASRVVNSPLASGCMRSCWRMNWLRVMARPGILCLLVRETAHVLGPARRAHRRAERGERAGHERCVLLGQRPRALDGELAEQERELVLERLADRLADRGRHSPHLALEETERLLAGLVEELLVGVARLALVGGRGAEPLVDLALEVGGEGGMVVDHVLELGRQVDLAGAEPGEAVEQ